MRSDSEWEEEKRRQPIKSTWWRTVMIRNELEETWSKVQAKAQDDRLKSAEVLLWPFVPAGMRRLSEWVSECFATFEKLWSPSLCSQNLQLLSLANIPYSIPHTRSIGKSCKFVDLQVCRHSVMVAASTRYPLHNLQVMCWLRFTNGNLTRFCKKTMIFILNK